VFESNYTPHVQNVNPHLAVAPNYASNLAQAWALSNGAQQRGFTPAQSASYGGAQINAPDLFRNQQVQLGGMLGNAAMGNGPSVAQQQLRMGQQQNMQNAMSQMASMRGNVNPSMAMRALQNNTVTNGQNTNMQAALLRNQEMQNAYQNYAQFLGQARGQDTDLATNQAGLTQQAGLANSANQQQTNMGNLQAFLQNRQLNDAMQQYGMNNAFGLDQGQMAARLQIAQGNQNAQAQMQQLQMQQAIQNAQNNQSFWSSLIGGVTGGAGMLGAAALM